MSEKIEKFLEYVEKLKTEQNKELVESIVEGFNTLYEYGISRDVSTGDDIMEGETTDVVGRPDPELEDESIVEPEISTNEKIVVEDEDETKEDMEEVEEKKEIDEKEIDDKEGRMIKGQLLQISEQADKLARMLEDEEQLKAWFQSKVAKAQQMIDDVFHYYENRENVKDLNDEIESKESEKPIMEEGPTTSEITPEMLAVVKRRKLAEQGNEAYKLFKQGVISEDEYNNYLGIRSRMIDKELEENPVLAESSDDIPEELMECAKYNDSLND